MLSSRSLKLIGLTFCCDEQVVSEVLVLVVTGIGKVVFILS